MSLTIKADGDTERQLLDLLTRLSTIVPQWSPPPSTRTTRISTAVPVASSDAISTQPAISQQQLDDLLYLAQQQQLQLEQSQRAIADYQQAFISLAGNGQLALPAASATVSGYADEMEGPIDSHTGATDATEDIVTPRYITGGLGKTQTDNQIADSTSNLTTDQVINADARTTSGSAHSPQRKPRSFRASNKTDKWLERLIFLSLLSLTMSAITWVTFRWIAPAVDSFLRPEVTNPAGESNQGQEEEPPASSLSEPAPSSPPVAPPRDTNDSPGSAQSKAGSQPNALEGL